MPRKSLELDGGASFFELSLGLLGVFLLGVLEDRLRSAFPFLLEIRRETGERPAYEAAAGPEQAMDPFGLCCSFLKETDEREQEILRDVINQVREETGCGH